MSTDEKTPTTRLGIRDRLNAIAPYPNDATPDHARAVAKYLAVSAQRRWKYNLDIAGMDSAEYWLSTQAMMAEFAALHMLVQTMETAPLLAEAFSKQIRNAWDDGGEIGTWLCEHATALGIDPDEVSRLEVAWQAHSPRAAAAPAAPPAAPDWSHKPGEELALPLKAGDVIPLEQSGKVAAYVMDSFEVGLEWAGDDLMNPQRTVTLRLHVMTEEEARERDEQFGPDEVAP